LNLSIFQSLPDAWSINQVFPILPLSHLNQRPERRAVLFDITCDSDGIISHYVDGQGIETTLPVPSWEANSPYLLGFFLVGAYQEILGDLHNLFGDTDTVVARMDRTGRVHIEEIQSGDTVEDVLRYVNLESKRFLQTYRQLVRTHLERHEQREILAELEAGLRGYTYLEDIGGI
jgi:arginine decarboxylase